MIFCIKRKGLLGIGRILEYIHFSFKIEKGVLMTMKIYVSVDMEGISGVVLKEQLTKGELLYEEARHLLTDEVNVVVDSLRAIGVEEIYVKDAHSSGFNFLVHKLHSGAHYCVGATKIPERFPGLDSSFDGAMLIGYHAMGGVMKAIRDHTMTSVGWQSVYLNGNPVGEIALDSLLFGLHDVPVILVTGDDQTCAEAKREIANVTVYETKKAFGRHAGLIKPPKLVHEELKGIIKKSLENRVNISPYHIQGPYELTIKFISTDQADSRYFDGFHAKRVDGLTAAYYGSNLIDVISRAFN